MSSKLYSRTGDSYYCVVKACIEVDPYGESYGTFGSQCEGYRFELGWGKDKAIIVEDGKRSEHPFFEQGKRYFLARYYTNVANDLLLWGYFKFSETLDDYNLAEFLHLHTNPSGTLLRVAKCEKG